MALALVFVLVTGVVASVDHRRKAVQLARGHENEWFCAHKGLRCDQAGSAGIEERWEMREGIYYGLVGAAGLVFVLSGAAWWRRRPGSRSAA
jgi:hypothetical protein